jgi:hypothetical protein
MTALDRITIAICAMVSAGAYARFLLEDGNVSFVGIGVIVFLCVMALRQIGLILIEAALKRRKAAQFPH